MILDLVPQSDSILHTKCERFDFNNPPMNPIELANSLIETMVAKRGIGLSANQCGIPYRVFALWSNPTKVLFNPTIADTSSEEILLEEGCLSYPNLIIKVKRPKIIRVRYQDVTGEACTDKFIGMTARCVLHEMDHLNGLDFRSRANKYHYEQAMRKKKQLDRRPTL